MKKILRAILCAVIWIGIWELVSLAVSQSVILPSPAATAKKLIELLGEKEFHVSCITSLVRIFAGFLIGTALGIAFAALSHIGAEFIISPAVTVIKSTPVASIIIVMLFLIGKDKVPTVSVLLMVLPVIYANVLKGLRSPDKNMAEVAKVYGFSRAKKLKYCTLPAVIPFFSAGVKTSIGLAWKAGIAAEVICTPKISLGTLLYDAKIYLESEELFALTAAVIILSLIIEKALVFIIDVLSGGKKYA
ncbi:MAG: ABC transporter permease subunit [Clostridiales bacterium]|nr:ABC transporter permease subunit [Clostridiales bacterium]